MDKTNPVNEHLITGFSHLHPHLHIKDSPIQGRGVFSDVDIKKGAVLWEIIGQRIQHEYTPRLAAENPNWIGTGYEEWVVMGPGDMAIYLNHSCNPNVIVNEKLEIIAMAPIRANEELLLDYSTTELDPYWKMECGCGAKECRKILRSFQYLPEELRNRYGKFISPLFLRVAEALEANKATG